MSETSGHVERKLEKRDSGGVTDSYSATVSVATESYKRFEPFVGTFKATVKLWTGSGDPEVSVGVMTNTLVLEGRYLKQVFKGEPSSNSGGHGFWGFNKTTNKYEGFWIDTASTEMQTQVGEVDDTLSVWTIVGEMTDPKGNKLKKRSVITLEDNDHQKMEMFFSSPDGKEFKAMEIRYERM